VYLYPFFRFIHQIIRKEKSYHKQKSYNYSTTFTKLLIFHNTNRWITTPHDDDAFENHSCGVLGSSRRPRWQRLFPTEYQRTLMTVMGKRKAVITCVRLSGIGISKCNAWEQRIILICYKFPFHKTHDTTQCTYPQSMERYCKYCHLWLDTRLNWSFLLSVYGSTALCWALAAFSVFDLYTTGRTPWTGDQPVVRQLLTQANTNTEQTHANIHASSGIRTHDFSIWAGEDCSCAIA
jgi:hypothetical protein